MWPFTRAPQHASCRKQIADLQDSVQTLEGQLGHLQLELDDRYEKLFDRVQRLYARLVKRQDREDPTDNGNGAAQGEAESAPLALGHYPMASTAHLAARFKRP